MTGKKKKTPQNLEIKIYHESLSGGGGLEKKKLPGARRKGPSCHTNWKKNNQEIRNQLVKRKKKKPTVKCCEATITKSAQY